MATTIDQAEFDRRMKDDSILQGLEAERQAWIESERLRVEAIFEKVREVRKRRNALRQEIDLLQSKSKKLLRDTKYHRKPENKIKALMKVRKTQIRRTLIVDAASQRAAEIRKLIPIPKLEH